MAGNFIMSRWRIRAWPVVIKVVLCCWLPLLNNHHTIVDCGVLHQRYYTIDDMGVLRRHHQQVQVWGVWVCVTGDRNFTCQFKSVPMIDRDFHPTCHSPIMIEATIVWRYHYRTSGWCYHVPEFLTGRYDHVVQIRGDQNSQPLSNRCLYFV